jgi:hypothetical protein
VAAGAAAAARETAPFFGKLCKQRQPYGTLPVYDAGMGQHHNPYDPRDPLSPAFYLFFIGDGGNGGRRGRPSDGGWGCGCLALSLVLGFALLIGALT